MEKGRKQGKPGRMTQIVQKVYVSVDENILTRVYTAEPTLTGGVD